MFTGGFFAAHAVVSGWAGAAATAGRAQSASLYSLGYYAGFNFFGWLGGILLAQAGWPGTVLMAAALAWIDLLLAWIVLPSRKQSTHMW